MWTAEVLAGPCRILVRALPTVSEVTKVLKVSRAKVYGLVDRRCRRWAGERT